MALKGKKVLITRPQGSQDETIRLFSDKGAVVKNIPMVKTMPTPKYDALKSTNGLLKNAKAVVLSSPRGALMFCEKAGDLSQTLLVAVGPGTAKIVAQKTGISPALPDTFDQEGLLRLLKTRLKPGEKAVYFGARNKRAVLRKGLQDAGIELTDFAAYRTICRDLENKKLENAINQADFICFFSPSGVNCMKDCLGMQKMQKKLAEKIVVAIGHVTSAALLDIGIDCVIPKEHTPQSMVELTDTI